MRHLRGATLMEVLLAFTLTALLLVLILNLFPSAMATVRRAEQRQVAGNLAESLLERKASLGFDRLPVGTLEDTPGDFRVRFEVTAVANEDPRFLRALTVSVNWTDRGRALQVQRGLWMHRLGYRL